jgi:AcrR family transcriptional regulator
MDGFDRIGEEDGDAGEAAWNEEGGAAPADQEGMRHDGFGALRKHKFLKIYQTTGCIADGCRRAGISRQTFYNHLESDARFANHVRLALRMAGTTVELMAWERGVEGIEEDVVRGGKVVGTRLKRSDSILRLLLQGSNPEKYGPRPGFSRARLLKHERQRIEAEVLARIAAQEPDIESVRDKILRKLENIRRHEDRKRLAEGWIQAEEGVWIPPGWVKADEAGAPASSEDGTAGASEASCEPGGAEGRGETESGLGPIEIKSMPMGTVTRDPVKLVYVVRNRTVARGFPLTPSFPR